jgi:AbrB family looped-hinge helix DNA binding protein
MAQATISSKNQIVIPREAREALDLRAGDKVAVVVRGKRVLMLQKPASHRAAIRGLASTAYPAGHLQKERRGWE